MKKLSSQNTETPDHQRAGELRQIALNLLARREHSHQELERKLLVRGFSAQAVASAIEELVRQGSQSNTRFAEHYVYSRVQKGFGPLRIRAELRERGIENPLVAPSLEGSTEDWEARAKAARVKRFGAELPADFTERARQARFLQQRGYTPDQIRSALADTD